ncbi:MAG: peptide deformylase [Gammaproteobacteria bacterium]
MAILKILQYPDARLKRIAVKVDRFDESIQKVIDDMFETHYSQENCAALAATQLDIPIPWRITVIDFSEAKNQPLCLVNPKIVECEGEQNEPEGCMSVYPGHCAEKVKRSLQIVVEAQDRHGAPLRIPAEGYMAKCIQHEIDHLDGYLYLDRIPSLKKERLLKNIKRLLRDKKNN